MAALSKYRARLPQLGDGLFLTDGGLETTLIFHEGIELPDFAAFHLLKNPEARGFLKAYFLRYVDLARRFKAGLILESATWRASRDWGQRLGYSTKSLADANRDAISLLEEIRTAHESPGEEVVISGCIGPRGDGYVPAGAMTVADAENYHGEQIGTIADTAADMVCAMTLNYVEEAIGVVNAARRSMMPAAIAFTVETDGNLPTGQTLASAIMQVDEATDEYPSYYMVNCAHPTHFDRVVSSENFPSHRVRGIRANASRKSHAELNESPEIDIGDPVELASQYAQLLKALPKVNVMGGCCGTDHRHVEEIARACSPFFGTTT